MEIGERSFVFGREQREAGGSCAARSASQGWRHSFRHLALLAALVKHRIAIIW